MAGQVDRATERGKALNFYPHHIGDFNNATRHLTRVERSLYADCIWLYYDTEQPLQAVDFDLLARKVMARTDEEKAALRVILAEFFVLDGDVHRHARCDAEIEAYRGKKAGAQRAGQASAAKRLERKGNGRSTDVKQVNDKRATNQEPLTKNQEPIKDSANFVRFWSAYPNKKAKGAAIKEWAKIKPNEQLTTEILDSLRRATTSADWLKENGAFIPHPATWLNNERWLDEFGGVTPQREVIL